MKQLFYFLSLMLVVSFAHAVGKDQERTYTFKVYAHKHARGLVRNAKSRAFLNAQPRKSFLKDNTPIPAKATMRGIAGPVEDQGTCGSCWDFSLTSVLRGTWLMAGPDKGRLSFNYLLNCATTAQNSMGCDGGDFPAAQLFVSPQGAPAYGSDGEYTGTDGTCSSEPAIASAVQFHMLGSDAGAYPQGVTPSFKDIAYVISVLHRPVSIDVTADPWENYASGIFNDCSDANPADIDHMVSLEGYDCETSVDNHGNCVFDANGNLPAGVGTWLIRNSWGTEWGDEGYITTKATDSTGAKCNSVATDALYYDVE